MAENRPNLKRRLLIGGALLAPLAYAAAKRPSERSGAHDAYFRGLQAALKRAGLARPTLVIDRAALEHNLARIKAHLPANKAFRVVAKSLPSVPLLAQVRAAMATDRLMVFHQPDLNLLAEQMPDARMLLGKPMPVVAAQRYFARAGGFESATRVEWLVDTPQRIAEYRELARNAVGTRLKLNLELDVGLHRGGFARPQDVAEAVRAIDADRNLEFADFMGYEAHASKMPDAFGGPRAALARAMAIYAEGLAAAREVLGDRFDPARLTLNAGGSTTYQMYDESAPCNELALGSACVMPTDFDRPTLADHRPACFIATPVLKALERTELPGLERMTGLLSAWDPNTARAFYLYGGYWLANPVSPPGLQRNAIWGHSTNQDLLNGSARVELGVDDYVFFRPHQSEFVFLQFGDIAVYDGQEIAESWPVFAAGA